MKQAFSFSIGLVVGILIMVVVSQLYPSTIAPKVQKGFSTEVVTILGESVAGLSILEGVSVRLDAQSRKMLTENSERIVGSGVMDPINRGLLYFSTEKGLDIQEVENALYSYNIYEKQLSKIGVYDGDRVLRLIGRDGENLVFMLDYIDNSPGPCFNAFADWEEFVSFNPFSGGGEFSEYQLPQELVDAGKSEQQECMKDFR